MRLGRWMIVLGLAFSIVGLTACGGGKYGEAKKAMEKSIQIMDDFANGMDKADNAKEVAATINKFTKGMEALKPVMEELEKKHPEIKDQSNLPSELAPYAEKFAEIGQKFMSAIMKTQKYQDDPEVQKAMEKMNSMR